MKELAEKIIKLSLKKGATQARVCVSKGMQTSIEYDGAEIDSICSSGIGFVELTLFIDGRRGVFSTYLEENMEDFVTRSVAFTKIGTPESEYCLPDRERCWSGLSSEDLEQYDPEFPTLGAEEKKRILEEAVSKADLAHPKLLNLTTSWEDAYKEDYTLDSNGAAGLEKSSVFSLGASASVKGQGDAHPGDSWYDGGVCRKDTDILCARKALDMALERIPSRNIKGGRFNLILDSSVSASMVSPILAALSGSAIQQHSSFLAGSLGRKMFPEKLCIADNPFVRGRVGARHFDFELVRTRAADIISEGCVQMYFLSSYYARKLGMEPTISTPTSVYFKNTDCGDLTEMMSAMGNGILVTDFIGGNTNPVTGDFSYGIEGFYFENGKKSFPVVEMNITGNLLSLWAKLALVGNDARKCTPWQLPSIGFTDIDII